MNPAPSQYSIYHVYLLKSKADNSLYIGYTNNLNRRLDEHNSGLVGYTKKFIPWTLLYYESFTSIEDAKKREKSLKYFGRAYSQLKKRIINCLQNE